MSSQIKSAIRYNSKAISDDELIEIYKNLLKPRMIEEKMLKLLRQGKVSKWFSGIGQEAIAVGATLALEEDEIIFPMHRNMGVFTSRNIPLHRLFCQWQGKEKGFTKGRDRSFHFGAIDYNIVGMISHLGPQLSLASGVALAHKLRKQEKVSLAFTGEGGTSQGEFHEALNVAAVWKLPVIFIVENNGYGLSTPKSEQFACKDIVDKGKGYGMKSLKIDGNNVLEVFRTIRKVAQEIRRRPEPYLIECVSFRMRGHEEASGTKYVPKKLMEEWALKDPVENFEHYILKKGVVSRERAEEIRSNIRQEIESELEIAYNEDRIDSTVDREIQDVFASHEHNGTQINNSSYTNKRFIDAIHDALDDAMDRYGNLVLMGQDIAEYGGVFKITEGLYEKYGADRVRNTPLCESSILGIAVGMSIKSFKSMVEMQFADFVTCGFNQIINNMAKLHYRWGQNVDVVVRMPTGGGVGAGPFHSQCNEVWFTHTPGLKVVYPSNPYDAKGLLLASFEDPNPVLFFEHKGLYRNISEDIPDDYYTVEIGKAKLVAEGDDVSIITYGMGVHWAQELINEENISVDLLDLRTLSPLDYIAIDTTVKKTGKVILLHEDTLFGGIGGEISAYISENLFEYLDGPVVRVASLDTPVPFAKDLENMFMPVERLKQKIAELLQY
jgi:2-oxoisovalerate dehydrogenase E1 component